MSLKVVCGVVIIAVSLFDVIAKNRETDSCGIQASNNQNPWLVGIEFVYNEDNILLTLCTGALISRWHVISNAHCFDGITFSALAKSVHLGPKITEEHCTGGKTGDQCTDGTIRIPIDVVIPYPQYKPPKNQYSPLEHNIALVKLSDSVPYIDTIGTICLPTFHVKQLAAKDRHLSFTGVDELNGNKKLHAAMTYLDGEKCVYPFGFPAAASEFCANSTEVINSCMRRGGILMNQRGNTYELTGLLQHKTGCESTKVFTPLFPYLDWIRSETPEWTHGCGRRKVKHLELIVNGEETKPGDWPWHVAIYKLMNSEDQYICGGTLVASTMVLTAAHCTTERGEPVMPEVLSVILGKYSLMGEDLQSQKIDVQSVIVHEDFVSIGHLDNDISLLKLKKRATYTDYILPACIWHYEAYKRLPNSNDLGQVVGWGRDENEGLSPQLKVSSVPKVPYDACVEKDPQYYVSALKNKKKFCAGWANGTSPCNGDSGGGFFVFVPDTPKASSSNALGSWYVRRVVSVTLASRNFLRCDPYKYVIFTDVTAYTGWIQKHLDN